jgi:hypothetical protein
MSRRPSSLFFCALALCFLAVSAFSFPLISTPTQIAGHFSAISEYLGFSTSAADENLIVPQANISFSALDAAYTQNFDTLSNVSGSTTNTLTIPGWLMTEGGGGARDNEQYAVDTGVSTTGDTYSYGAAASTERALGEERSGTLIPLFGAGFTNNTGATITSLDVSFNGEEWRLGTAGRTDQLNFEISTNATDLVTGTWSNVAALNFVTPDTATAGAKNGNAAADRTALSTTITGISIPNGASFFIRWNDIDATGADDGLAVDDFSITPHQIVSANTDLFRTKQTGNWNDVATWESSPDGSTWIAATLTPDSAANTITVRAGHTVDVTADVTVDQVVIASGATLKAESSFLTVNDGSGADITDSGTLQIENAITNNGQITINNGLLIDSSIPNFAGPGTVAYDPAATLYYGGIGTLTAANTTSTAMFWPTTNGPQNFTVLPGTGGADIQVPRTLGGTLTTSGGLYSGQNYTINGALVLNYGAQVNGNPTYGPNSGLLYDFGGHQANRGGEWAQAITSGAGYPHDVRVSGNTALNVAFGAASDFVQMGGKLTIDSGSTVETNGMFNSLIVAGGVQLDGTLGLAASGGDLHVSGGDWNRSITGVLAARSRSVYFDSTADQTIYGDNTWDFLIFPNSGARTIKFEAGKTQTTNGFNGFTVNGSGGNLVSLRSTVDGTQWKIVAANGHSVNYANVKDSDATGSSAAISPTNSVNSGNNTNWNFPVPATVDFSSSVYQAVEGTSQAALTLTRGGSSSTAFSVDVSTSGGTATSGFCGSADADYQSIQTTVSFTSGETTKVVNVPICDDLLTESPAETFTVTLSNPTNGILLGPQTPATVKILDAATEFTNATALSASPGQTTSSDIVVGGYQGSVIGMRVTLSGLSATIADDVDILLVSPSGHKYALLGDVGGSANLNNVTLTFEDPGSGGFIPDSGPIAEGQNYKPTNCESPVSDFSGSPSGGIVEPGCGPTLTNSLASTFGGENPDGTWTLYLRDDNGASLGVSSVSISGWGVQFLSPTAAPVSVSGRVVTVAGEGVRGASVTISGGDLAYPMSVRTDALGRYSFTGLRPGVTYIISARAKRSVIANATRAMTLLDDLAGIDFIAERRE